MGSEMCIRDSLQLVPVLRVDTDVYSYYVNIVSGEISRVSA